jgi:hypothetical protein
LERKKLKGKECEIMLVKDPVLRIGLRPVFQSWGFFFPMPLFPDASGKKREEK